MMETLTPRERQVLRLIAAGRSTKLLAADLGIAFKTAACHRATILGKIGAANTADLICRAVRMGLVDAEHPDQTPHPSEMGVRIEALRRESEKARDELRAALLRTTTLIMQTVDAREELQRFYHEVMSRRRLFHAPAHN